MCGIFGITALSNAGYDEKFLKLLLEKLAILSESRGKESAGFSFRNIHDNEINVLKAPVPVSALIKTKKYEELLKKSFNGFSSNGSIIPYSVMGHSRLVTNGTQLEDCNNQPVIKDSIVAVHNGIIVNVNELWKEFPALNRKYEIDTEVMLSLFGHYFSELNSVKMAIAKTLNKIKGTVSTAMMFGGLNKMLLITNNGSLYTLTNSKRDILLFASEKYILKELIRTSDIINRAGNCEIKQIRPNSGLLIEFSRFRFEEFLLKDINNSEADDRSAEKVMNIKVHKGNEDNKANQIHSIVNLNSLLSNSNVSYEKKLLQNNYNEISKLKRCSKCLLPETFPFIDYDEKGVCNYCRNYVKKNQPKPVSVLHDLVEPFRRGNGEPDCIIPFSGGRDSTYVLHYTKKELGLNPIAFTYDWGMVTDLARRNIARVCGKLGVENIIVSADIHFKRKNINKNISAWLRNPSLGMIPLFMAGDKYFFYYCNQLKKQTGIKLNIWGINALENTDFKTGFAGIKPKFDKKRIYSLNLQSQLKLFSFVGKNFLGSPQYLNRSVFDTLGSFFVRYLYPNSDYYLLYDFIQWDEKLIENTIQSEYKWEKATDTDSTWRIGDGTAGFYNYIYYTVAGFSEIDTFRSNQIREGLLSREDGLKKAEEENAPRYETIKWYLEIIGLDFENTIKAINKIPKLYRL